MNPPSTCAAAAEMRFNPITRDWVIVASGRSLRPNDFLHSASQRPARPPRREDCPFCVGNETMTLDEISRAEAGDGSWLVRVVPNKFPFLTDTGDLGRTAHATFRSMAAAGAHEVVIEHPQHNVSLADMGPAHVAELLRIYRGRYAELRQRPAVESIVIFKNHGERAGTSLEHPHSQIAAAPVVSSQVRLRMQEAGRYYDEHGQCLYCRVLHDELDAGERILETSRFFVAFVPYAALSPYHIWIFPRDHASSYDAISDEQIGDLAQVLNRVLRRLSVVLADPDYNFSIRSAPVSESVSNYYHWYVAIVPRVSHVAGFEIGSGMFVNSLRPEQCAEILRCAPIDL